MHLGSGRDGSVVHCDESRLNYSQESKTVLLKPPKINILLSV